MRVFRKSGYIVEKLIRDLNENYSDDMDSAANKILKKLYIYIYCQALLSLPPRKENSNAPFAER